MNMDKNNMKPYVFKHPDYGWLRVLVVDGIPYYCILDVRFIFDKGPKKLYKAIALSTGEVRSFKIVVKPHNKENHNPFFNGKEIGVSRKRKKDITVDYNFCDEQLIADLLNQNNPDESLGFKWITGFVKRVLAHPEVRVLYDAQEAEVVADNSISQPNSIVLSDNTLWINDQVFH
ncbi:hypothetical protein DW657_16805 [Prevotella sp. AM23-5]|nr:hypothetical protein DW657_16805 [Prevotella sp. AM23-5]